MPVRIGLHSGEVIHEDDDVHGAAVAAAARICAVAHGGQILASDVLVRMAGKVPGLEVTDRGSFRLKGFPEPVAILEVV